MQHLVLMAADQYKKRLNSVSHLTCYSGEKYRAKRKKFGSSQYDSNMKTHISLEWNGNQKKVIAKREQVGLSWKNFRPFVDYFPHGCSPIADVYAVPKEIYELENLNGVLSYEVWENHLSENERKHLLQFLPGGPEAEQVVQQLLAGDDFHFGNPFLKWGASICSGDLHPDAIFLQDRNLKIEKKAYYSDLHKYHHDMIGCLLKLKERFACCNDPEKEIMLNTWRSRNDMENRVSYGSDSRFRVPEENITATSESCSWVADEMACSSDNQNTSMVKGGKLHNRVFEKGFQEVRGRNSLPFSDDVHNMGERLRKGDKLKKQNIHCTDGAKYMSYVKMRAQNSEIRPGKSSGRTSRTKPSVIELKISKKQHEIVKSMKQSGKNIQSRSLNQVLGNINSFDVQPYEVFVEEEQKKLREHWLQLVNKALPAAYANWRELNIQRRQVRESLEQDLKDRPKFMTEDNEDSESGESSVQDHRDVRVTKHVCSPEDNERPVSVSGSPQPQEESPVHVDRGHDFNLMDIESGKQITKKSDSVTLSASGYLQNVTNTDTVICQGLHLSPTDVWPAANTPRSYYGSTASHEYSSTAGMPIAHPQVTVEHRSHLIDMESDLRVGESGKGLLHRRSGDDSFKQSEDTFDSYPNQDRNELLQSLFKDQGMLSYHQEQKQTSLDFQPTSNMLMEGGHFPGHFQEQPHSSLPMQQGQKRENEGYLRHNLSENMYSDGGRFLIPRHESLTPIIIQDWAVNNVRLQPRLQSQLNSGELLSQNWFSGDHQIRGGWTGSDSVSVTSQSIGSGSSGDQSLFSVLSHCSQLRSGSPYHPSGSNEQFIPSRNYGIVGGITPRISNAPQATHSLDYMGSREVASSLMPDDMGWMGLPHQNSGLHDPLGKPYLRSWNP